MVPRCVTCVAFALLVEGALAPHAACAKDHWRRVVTPRFTLYSAAHPDDVTRTAYQLEAMAVVLGRFGLGAPTGCRPRTVLIGFPERKAFDPHRPIRDGRPIKVEGYCVQLPFGRWIGYLESEERGRLISRHEFAHTVVADAFWRVPVSLNEGMAEFLSTFQVQADEVAFGHPLDAHRFIVQSSELLALDQLLAPDAEAVNALDHEAQAVFYAESWALVHYLARNGFDGLIRFVQSIASGDEPRLAFADAFPSEDWDQIPRRLKSYVDVDVLRYHIVEADDLAIPPASAVVLQDVSPGEVMANIGLWRLESDADPSGTERCFDQALAEAPGHGLALVGQGMMALGQERFDVAGERLRSGAAGTPDAQTLFIAGFGLLQLAQESRRAGRGGLTEEAYALLERSVALDSTDATALAWYGRAGAALGDYSDAVIRALERASRALPSDPVLAADLASTLARVGAVRRSSAIRSGFTRVAPGTDPRSDASGANARDSVMRDYNLGVAAANQGRYARAIEFFQRVVAAREGALSDSAAAIIRRLDGRPEQVAPAGSAPKRK